MIVQVSKKHSDTIYALAQLGPTYMSPNSVEGEKDCKLFFPKGYDVPEVEEVEVEVKKKSKKKKKLSQQTLQEDTDKTKTLDGDTEQKETFVEGQEAGDETDFSPEMAEDEETLGEDEEVGEFEDEMPEETDKATSPMVEEGNENLVVATEEAPPAEEPPAE